MGFWKGKKVLVTGGAGFLGSYVVEEVLRRGARVRVADNLSSGSLTNLAAVREDVEFIKADIASLEEGLKVCRGQEVVLNLAARVGGVDYNVRHPGTMFRDNILLAVQALEAARRSKVERFLAVSSACVYARESPVPTPENEGFNGRPEETNEGYGWAKRMAEFSARAYHEEFDMRVALVRPFNAYGPRDHFEPEISHVIGSLIRRLFEGESPLTVWGDGSQTRSFLYATDFARGVADVCEKYAEQDPVNIGTGEETTIGDLARTIVRISGSKVELRFDPSKPSGQPRRKGDVSKAAKVAGFKAQVKLEEGLKRTIEWYAAQLSVPGK